MPAQTVKTQKLSKGKTGKKHEEKSPALQEALTTQQISPATTFQRANADPRTLTPGNVLQLQRAVGNQAVNQLLTQSVQKKKNNTGLPDDLKDGIEDLSGIAIDDVRVHYNSPKPSEVQALAYTQGTDIYVAPNQERHLPHEAWHAVQQMQGRVHPTMQLKDGLPVNDDERLEHEADAMGANASANVVQRQSALIEDEEKPRQGKFVLGTAPVVQMLEHGFDMIGLRPEDFKDEFLNLVVNGRTHRNYTITSYDEYLILAKAEQTEITEKDIKKAGDRRIKTKADLLAKYKENCDMRESSVSKMEGDVASITHPKKRKPSERRTALLGTYLEKKRGQSTIANTLNEFVEGNQNQGKAEARKQKWLRVPDEEWSALVNARWIKAMASYGHPFKIISPLTDDQKEMIKKAFESKNKGVDFLKLLRTKYWNKNRSRDPHFPGTNNPLWRDTGDDPEADAPSNLSYEIAQLLDAGGYMVDEEYDARKHLIKLLPAPTPGASPAGPERMEELETEFNEHPM